MTLVESLKGKLLGKREPDESLEMFDPEWKARRQILLGAEGKGKPLKGYDKYFGDQADSHIDHPLTGTSQRKAVASVNAYWGIYGIYREGFWQSDNDRLARNPIFAICEKGIMDYLGIVEWEVIDHKEDQVQSAIKFLKRPNPQETFPTLLKMTARDVIRYDAGAWVKTLSTPDSSGRQHLLEIKAYSGPEFWVEIDRDWRGIAGEDGMIFNGPYSLGYVRRYWQHAKAGIFIPFEPKEVVYFMCYPRADNCYGTDFMQELKWYFEALIDSTKAAGMTFANGVMPGLKYLHPQYTSVTQLIESNAELEAANMGPDNFNGVIHLIGEEDVETLTPTMVDMQWLEGQMWMSKIIWAMFGFSSSEFVGDDVNRATAYVARNITKSRMLSPLLRKFEEMINENILPDLPGYEPGWKFKFKDVVDLDDELKQTQVDQGRAQVAATFMQIGVPLEAALTLAGIEEEKIERAVQAMEEAQEAAWNQGMEGGGGPMGPPGPGGAMNTNPQAGQQLSPGEAAQYYSSGSEDQGPQLYKRDNTAGSALSQDHEGSDEDVKKAHDADREDIVNLGKEMNQTSVIFCDHGQNEMITTRGDRAGEAVMGKGFSWVEPDAKEDFTAVYLQGKNASVNFALNFDFDHPSSEDVKNVEEEKPGPELDMDPQKLDTITTQLYNQGRGKVDQVYNTIRKSIVSYGHFEGLEYRLKTDKAIRESLNKEHRRHPHLPEDQLTQYLDDVVRFTSVVDPEKYLDNMNMTLQDLERKGAKILKIKNAWRTGGGCYRGVNVKLNIKGQAVELQFHTPESWEIKQKKTHQWYEVARSPPSREAKKTAVEMIRKIYSTCKYPPRMENWHYK